MEEPKFMLAKSFIDKHLMGRSVALICDKDGKVIQASRIEIMILRSMCFLADYSTVPYKEPTDSIEVRVIQIQPDVYVKQFQLDSYYDPNYDPNAMVRN